ncbi:MAG: hypothetical protein OXR62_13240 [Ahrensia sp.]|nr:hypothetical protein [Ahrensia sp.]
MPRFALLIFGSILLSGCNATVSTTSTHGLAVETLKVCSGYGCKISDTFQPSEEDVERLVAIMKDGAASPEAERTAIKRAIAEFETTARRHLRYQPDVKKAYQKHLGKRGQMDCVDESLNTTGYLAFMAHRGLLKHHRVRKHYAERGLIVDGRYPHKSAVIIDSAETVWTVDSWYHDDGVEPEIMRLSAWRKVRDSFSI